MQCWDIQSAKWVTKQKRVCRAKQIQAMEIIHMQSVAGGTGASVQMCRAFDHWQITFNIFRITITNNVHIVSHFVNGKVRVSLYA